MKKIQMNVARLFFFIILLISAYQPAIRSQNRVHLTASRNNIRIGDSITFNANLFTSDSAALFSFYINKQRFASGKNVSEVIHTFDRLGTFIITVGVSTYNIRLFDSLMVIVNPSVAKKKGPPSNTLLLKVQNSKSRVKDTVIFTAISNIKGDSLEYWFNFADDTEILKSKSPSVQHIYQNPGLYIASVQLAINNQLFSNVATAKVLIMDLNSPYISLKVLNPKALTGDKIILIASTNITRGVLEYVFSLGGKNKPFRTNKDTIQTEYSEIGRYRVFVNLIQHGKKIAQSEVQEIIITSQPIPDLWKYIAAGLVILTTGYMFRKLLIKPVAPTFQAYPDLGKPLIKNKKEFKINYELHFNPNLAESQFQVSNEKNLIINKKVL